MKQSDQKFPILPTLRGLDFFKKALEYQRQYNKNGIAVHNALQTNGYFLDEQDILQAPDAGFMRT